MEKRLPPAYLEYASDTLSKRAFRELDAAQRGLLYTIKLELWVNHTLPSNHQKLSRILGFDVDFLDKNLTEIMSFLKLVDGDLVCPEIEIYRAEQKLRRDAQRDAAIKTNLRLASKKATDKEIT